MFHWLGNSVITCCNLTFGLLDRCAAIVSGKSVHNLSTQELCASIESADAKILLVDVRSDAERAVSTIPGAISQQSFESRKEEFADQTIVPFCTVGGRSYLFTRRLISQGVPARNYRDSILGWCRAGLPLENPEGKPTNAVHPYWRIFHVPDAYEVVTDSSTSN